MGEVSVCHPVCPPCNVGNVVLRGQKRGGRLSCNWTCPVSSQLAWKPSAAPQDIHEAVIQAWWVLGTGMCGGCRLQGSIQSNMWQDQVRHPDCKVCVCPSDHPLHPPLPLRQGERLQRHGILQGEQRSSAIPLPKLVMHESWLTGRHPWQVSHSMDMPLYPRVSRLHPVNVQICSTGADCAGSQQDAACYTCDLILDECLPANDGHTCSGVSVYGTLTGICSGGRCVVGGCAPSLHLSSACTQELHPAEVTLPSAFPRPGMHR